MATSRREIPFPCPLYGRTVRVTLTDVHQTHRGALTGQVTPGEGRCSGMMKCPVAVRDRTDGGGSFDWSVCPHDELRARNLRPA